MFLAIADRDFLSHAAVCGCRELAWVLSFSYVSWLGYHLFKLEHCSFVQHVLYFCVATCILIFFVYRETVYDELFNTETQLFFFFVYRETVYDELFNTETEKQELSTFKNYCIFLLGKFVGEVSIYHTIFTEDISVALFLYLG